MDHLTNPKTLPVEPDKPPIIEPGHTFGSVSDKIGSFVLAQRTPKGWWVGFGIGFIGVMLLGQTLANLLLREPESGASPTRWVGALTSSILSGGSESGMPAP